MTSKRVELADCIINKHYEITIVTETNFTNVLIY
jgi:hypothetical protein